MQRVLRVILWLGAIALLALGIDHLARRWQLEPPSRVIQFPRGLGE